MAIQFKNKKIQNNFNPLLLVIFLSSFILTDLALQQNEDDNLELIFVYEHIAEGLMAPVEAYNSLYINGVDEYRVLWEEGHAELTLMGKRQLYDLGVRNRIKYGVEGNGLKLINFSEYNTKEVLFHATDTNRTHQGLNSLLMGMYKNATLKTLNEQEIQASFPPNYKEWAKHKNDTIYDEILEEIESLGNQAIINNSSAFNVHPFPENRTFNLDNKCENIDEIRNKYIEGKDDLFFSYFLEHKEELRVFFQFADYSCFTRLKRMIYIAIHYLYDYKNCKDLDIFHNITSIDLEEYLEYCEKFYYDYMYHYYCAGMCSMESSRLMEDLLKYMKFRIMYYPSTTYYAPKLIIDSGHISTVFPIQMFLEESWKDKPEYGIKSRYCDFASNVIFELYKTKNGPPNYFVYYYIDDELIHIFDYDEFEETMRAHLFTQEDISNYCSNKEKEIEEEETEEEEIIEREEKEEEEAEEEEEEEAEEEEEEEKKRKKDKESFTESFNNNKKLWISLFVLIFTNMLGIIGIIFLVIKNRNLKKTNNSIEKDISLNFLNK